MCGTLWVILGETRLEGQTVCVVGIRPANTEFPEAQVGRQSDGGRGQPGFSKRGFVYPARHASESSA